MFISEDAQKLYLSSKCPIRSSVDGDIAGSVNFDGPSVPSVNCCSFCCSTTGPIFLLLVKTSFKCSNLRCLIKNLSTDSGVFPKWQEETPKRQKTSIWLSFWALPPMLERWQIGELFKSEYLLNYSEFSRILHACAQEPSAGYGSALGSPNPRLGFPFQVVGAALKSWLNLCNILYGDVSGDALSFNYKTSFACPCLWHRANVSPY